MIKWSSEKQSSILLFHLKYLTIKSCARNFGLLAAASYALSNVIVNVGATPHFTAWSLLCIFAQSFLKNMSVKVEDSLGQVSFHVAKGALAMKSMRFLNNGTLFQRCSFFSVIKIHVYHFFVLFLCFTVRCSLLIFCSNKLFSTVWVDGKLPLYLFSQGRREDY